MHGIRRSKVTSESLEARRQKEVSKITDYRTTVDELLDRKCAETYDQASFDLTTKALHLNPELYTAWNFRRTIFLEHIFPQSSPETIHSLLLNDLNLTTLFLKSLPKVYWIWTHRSWCLDNIPPGPRQLVDLSSSSTTKEEAVGAEEKKEEVVEEKDDGTWRREAWERELKLVEKMLAVDARNFHAWDYRRIVLTSLRRTSSSVPHSRDSELAYTKKKIEANFSNFSAWHQRGKVLGEGEFVGGEEEMKREFDLVSQALWTDPSDQSAWLYHRFLISKTNNSPPIIHREILTLKELLDLEPGAKWPLDTLVHYSMLLLNASEPPSAEDKEVLVGEIKSWLKSLEEVDPGRIERYRDLWRRVEEGRKD
ncbi:rab-protein geranylgeranyltransferase [Mrakia frigida]|uniref:Rab geranylgeranyltransferase BET4 n=1 Tax=Mrakia frigida TaxID=29902 RepID=UPI003FCC0CFA